MKHITTFLGVFALLLFAAPSRAVQELIQTGATTPIPFLLVDSATGQTGQTGQASNITVTVCKPGTTSYAAGSGTVAEIGNGLYNYTPTTTETGSGTTEGFLLIHATDTTDSAQVVDVSAQIVGFNPNSVLATGDSSGRVTLIPADVPPTAAAIATASAGDILLTPADLINTDSSGRVILQPTETGVTIPTVTTVTNAVSLPANAPSTFDANETTTQAISTQVNKLTFDGSNFVKSDVQTGSITTVTGNVGGNVGGNVAGSVGSVTAAVTLPANAPSTFDANETVAGNILSQTSAANQQSNAATGVLGATASSWNTSGTIGYKINNVSGGGGSVTDSSVQADVGTELNSLGYTPALATALGTTSTDIPLIYSQTSPATFYIQAANTTSGTAETLSQKQMAQLSYSELIGNRTFGAVSGNSQTGTVYLAGYGTTYPVETITINTSSGQVITRLIEQPFPNEP